MVDWLAFLHPVWQGVGIVLGFVALREGMALRRGRRTLVSPDRRDRQRARHARLGQYCLWMLGSGYVLGIAELWFVRQHAILRSAHFYFASLAFALFCWGAWYGFSMLRGTRSYAECLELHGFLVPLALFMMVGVGLLGLRLLP